MIANETTIHQNSTKLDEQLSTMRKPHSVQSPVKSPT